MPWNLGTPRLAAIHPSRQRIGNVGTSISGIPGSSVGAFKHIGPDDRNLLKIDLVTDEALKTSEIEGEVLDRASVQSSLRQQFGLGTETRRIPLAERGIAEMMVDVYNSFADP